MSELERINLASWKEGPRGTEHKITVMENQDSWLVLKQKKIHNTWTVEESWHSDERPDVG